MVIFGAGASYDSAQAFPVDGPHAGPWRPPLANDLFRDQYGTFGGIIRKYSKLTRILPYLREPTAHGSVEQTLESLQTQRRDYQERQRELAAVKFYLSDLLMQVTDEWHGHTNGVTNYAPLVDEILRLHKSDDPVCLVTFNYDLLLERALDTFDFKPRDPENYLQSHPVLKVFRLHGSVNWSRTVGVGGPRLSPQDLIERADALPDFDRFILANAATEWEAPTPYGGIFPAIAIPVQTKTEEHFECPASHREQLEQMLPLITKILIIGWQAREAHFLQMLKHRVSTLNQLTHLMVVGKDYDDSNTILRYFLDQIGKTSVPRTFYGKRGFTHFIVNQEGEEFLRE